MHVAVIGAGMIGTSIAVELARRGAAVELIDSGEPGGGTSGTSYAWVNANNKEPESYFRLNLAGVATHRGLAGANTDWLRPTGRLEFAIDRDHRAELRRRIDRLGRLGYPVDTVNVRQAQALIPGVVIPPECDTVAFFPLEAHLFPDRYIRARLNEGRTFDLHLHTRVSVEDLHPNPDGNGAQLWLSDGRVLAVDRVVCAAGRWTNSLTRLVGLPDVMIEYEAPGDVTVGYLVITEPLTTGLERMLTSPRLNVRPYDAGRLMLQAVDLDVTADPKRVPAPDSPLGREFANRLRAVLRTAQDAKISDIWVGYRAMPRDGRSIIGAPATVPWCYLVATHSGITLAPWLGQVVAAELYGQPEPMLNDFRPDPLLATRSGGMPNRFPIESAPRPPRRPGEQ